MGGKVPAEDMTPERIKLLETTRKVLADPQPRKYDRQGLLRDLLHAAEECPRMSCAYCEHQARSEAERQTNTTAGD